MKRLQPVRILGFLGTVTLAAVANAGPLGLLSIPIADILRHREMEVGLSASGNERRIDPGYSWAPYVQGGLYDKVDLGYDNDFLGRTDFNFKALLVEKTGFAFSVGMTGLSFRGERPTPYAVSRFDMGKVRLHAGVMRDDRYRGMIGVDAEVVDGITFMADCITGPGSVAWAGLNFRTPVPGLTVSIAGGVPFRRSEGVQHQIGLAYNFKV